MPSFFPAAVYMLCFVTCTLCAFLLTRSYLMMRARLLFWSATCFALLAINNLLVVFDIVIFPEVDLRMWRVALSLAAIGVLLFGFIWDLEEE